MAEKERNRWHPNWFACCPDDVQEELQDKATVMFQLLGELLEGVKE